MKKLSPKPKGKNIELALELLQLSLVLKTSVKKAAGKKLGKPKPPQRQEKS